MARTRSVPGRGGDGASCPDPERIVELMRHGLAAEESAWFELHIDACTECRVLLADLAELGSAPEDAPVGARPGAVYPRRGT